MGTSDAQAAANYKKQLNDIFTYFDAAFPQGHDDHNGALLLLWSAPLKPSAASIATRSAFSNAGGDLNNAFRTKINYVAVRKATGYVLAAHQFIDLENRTGAGPRFQSNLAEGATFPSGLNYHDQDKFGFSLSPNLAALQKLDELTSLSLAQQALLSGISLFGKITDGLQRGDKITINLLKNYPTVAQNYVHWRLRNDGQRAIPSANVAYAFAYRSKDENYMKGFASINMKFLQETKAEKCPDPDASYAPKPKGWSAMLAPCLYVALPTIEEFTSDVFRFTPGFYAMHDAKAKLQDAIGQYIFLRKTKDANFVVDDETFKYAVKRIVM